MNQLFKEAGRSFAKHFLGVYGVSDYSSPVTNVQEDSYRLPEKLADQLDLLYGNPLVKQHLMAPSSATSPLRKGRLSTGHVMHEGVNCQVLSGDGGLVPQQESLAKKGVVLLGTNRPRERYFGEDRRMRLSQNVAMARRASQVIADYRLQGLSVAKSYLRPFINAGIQYSSVCELRGKLSPAPENTSQTELRQSLRSLFFVMRKVAAVSSFSFGEDNRIVLHAPYFFNPMVCDDSTTTRVQRVLWNFLQLLPIHCLGLLRGLQQLKRSYSPDKTSPLSAAQRRVICSEIRRSQLLIIAERVHCAAALALTYYRPKLAIIPVAWALSRMVWDLSNKYLRREYRVFPPMNYLP